MRIAVTALVLLFTGGQSIPNYLVNIDAPVRAAVKDKETVERILTLSKQLEQQLLAQSKRVSELRSSFLDLHADYDTTEADFNAITEKMIAAGKEGQKSILDARTAMRKLMTREEWNGVFGDD